MSDRKLFSVPGRGVQMRPHRSCNGRGGSPGEIEPSPEIDSGSEPESTPEPTPIPKRRQKTKDDE